MRLPISADRSLAACSSGARTNPRWSRWAEPRVLLRPQPDLYVMRLRRAAPLVPALIGDYDDIAFMTDIWTFEAADLDRVPMTLITANGAFRLVLFGLLVAALLSITLVE